MINHMRTALSLMLFRAPRLRRSRFPTLSQYLLVYLDLWWLGVLKRPCAPPSCALRCGDRIPLDLETNKSFSAAQGLRGTGWGVIEPEGGGGRGGGGVWRLWVMCCDQHWLGSGLPWWSLTSYKAEGVMGSCGRTDSRVIFMIWNVHW